MADVVDSCRLKDKGSDRSMPYSTSNYRKSLAPINRYPDAVQILYHV